MGINLSKRREVSKLQKTYNQGLKTRRRLITKLKEIINNLDKTYDLPNSAYKDKWIILYERNFTEVLTELEDSTSQLKRTAIELGPAWEYALQNRLKETTVRIPPDIQDLVSGKNYCQPAKDNMPKQSNNCITSSKKSTKKANLTNSNT